MASFQEKGRSWILDGDSTRLINSRHSNQQARQQPLTNTIGEWQLGIDIILDKTDVISSQIFGNISNSAKNHACRQKSGKNASQAS